LFTTGLAGVAAVGGVATERAEAVGAAAVTTEAVLAIGAGTEPVDVILAVGAEIVGAIAGLAVTATGDAGFGADGVVKNR
jgi:hypothetical protein